MRKVIGLALAALLVLGVVGTALAENGTIQPFKTGRARAMENGPIWPW